MALDLIRPIGLECSAEGGTQNAKDITEVNTLQDAVGAAGLFLDGPTVTSSDKTVLIDRASGGCMRFSDQTATNLLSDLMTISTGTAKDHAQIRDIQHFLANEGPGTGFASGAVCARSFSGILLTSETWYTSSAMTTKIYSRTLAYASGSIVPSSATYVIYTAAGAVAHTVIDTYGYSGLLCVNITRTWS